MPKDLREAAMMDNEKREELKPCPFCGSEPEYQKGIRLFSSKPPTPTVWCANEVCPIRRIGCEITAWNTRAASVDRKAIAREAFEEGRASVVFEPHSAYRDKLREMICEGDFDFTKIFEEIEYEGETYTDISNEGADALADYFIGLMEMIDERRSEDAEQNRQEATDAVLETIGDGE